ncbi:MAG: hypothetical protein LBV74_02695 [Tannerella sp.]|jgi:hypothetical protein|nr:hypothetical protein [Tannerella sp.]
MKNLLLLLTTAIVLFSCSSQDEVINQNEVIEKEDLMLTEENTEEIKLRIASPDLPIYAPSNLQEIYEYASFENGKYYDFYYRTTKPGNSFYDSRSGRTYVYQRVLGKFAKNLLPYRNGGYFGVEICRLVYIPSSNTYSFVVYEARPNGDYYEPRVIAEELGFTIYNNDLDDSHNYYDGHWGELKYYTSKEGNNEYHVGTKRLFDSDDIEDWDADPEWYKRWNGIALWPIGIIVK